MNYRLALLRRADIDAARIYRWIERRSPRGAMSWWHAFLEALDDLSERAHEFGVAAEPELAELGGRQRLFKTLRGRNYRILFVVASYQLRVLRVRGAGQGPLRRDDLRSSPRKPD